jgi:hypothetical protein
MYTLDMYRDFKQWFGEPWQLPWADNTIPACVESAVLDELERREWDVWFQPGEATVCHPNRPQVTCEGPTRLARLHAACKQSFGGG